MFITEINGKKLKKPLKIEVKKYYIAEIEDYDFYGEGDTEEIAVEDLKEAILDIYEYFKKSENDINDTEQKKKILDLFE